MPSRVTIASFAALAVPGLLALGSGCSSRTTRAPLPAAPGTRTWVLTGRAVVPAPEPEGVPRGSVAEEKLLPAPGARVTLEADPECACDSAGAIQPRSVTAGGDGGFRIDGVPGGATARLMVERDGTAVRAIRIETPLVVEDPELDVGDVLLDPGFFLRIRLVEERDRAVEGAKAIAFRDGRYRRGPSSTVACGESRQEARALGGGEYLVERLAPGDYGIFAAASDLVA